MLPVFNIIVAFQDSYDKIFFRGRKVLVEREVCNMYHNAGAKVKGLATTIAVLLMGGAVIGGLITMSVSESLLMGLLIIGVGCLAAWLSALMLAAFGELVENTYHIRKLLSEGRSAANAEPVRAVYADVSATSGINTNT